MRVSPLTALTWQLQPLARLFGDGFLNLIHRNRILSSLSQVRNQLPVIAASGLMMQSTASNLKKVIFILIWLCLCVLVWLSFAPFHSFL